MRKHPRFVREDLCVACGLCVEACPQVGGNEFDQGLKVRKAIYRPFPQSVPATYVLDSDHRVAWRDVGANMTDLPDADAVLAALRALD